MIYNSGIQPVKHSDCDVDIALPLTWRRESRHSRLQLQYNLFGELLLVRTWGDVNHWRIGLRKTVIAHDDLPALLAEIKSKRETLGFTAIKHLRDVSRHQTSSLWFT